MVSAKLNCYFTLWGFAGAAAEAVDVAIQHHYQGIEGPAPKDKLQKQQLRNKLRELQCGYICEIATTGTYIPDRHLSVRDHLHDLKIQLQNVEELQPSFVTCLGGCDAWSKEQSIEFFCAAMELAQESDLDISFETHRGRSLFNPWVTRDLVAEIPDIKLTFDVSHWCVVCEGLQETELQLIQQLSRNAHHIHARVGYDQGAQVPDPNLGVYRSNLQMHLNIWKQVWQQQMQMGKNVLTATPEFGLDGYQYRDINGETSLVDVREINRRMCQTLQEEFSQLINTMNEERPNNYEQ